MNEHTSNGHHAHAGHHHYGPRHDHHGHGGAVAEVTLVADPVCGMKVDPATSKHRAEQKW